MKTLLLSLLCLCVWSQSTEALTDQQVLLGHNVTLACEFKCKAAIWFVTKLQARPEMIMRTFGSTEQAKYYHYKFSSKYSEGGRSRLIINTVSVDDLGIYYCIKPGNDLQISVSDGIRLHTAESPRSHDEPEQNNPPQDQIPIIILSLLTVALFAAVIGLLMMNHKLSKKIPKYVNFHQVNVSEH
ncbi:uncharacterized protein LOC127988042 isoform X3 [Carassius gibelio]|uniref:uncharacterized protein LOC127988042 isoform X2 n=1 Tax=Carassius gibelio TaxID=101364 RepID=UPI002278AFAF|nr:uncharacterized protein LOC127988042 isoform X2 [Carassius gibelio]XP_052446521.1 uncharacterized protein LOC127988042 isoform X3 [Carassius gibelio]